MATSDTSKTNTPPFPTSDTAGSTMGGTSSGASNTTSGSSNLSGTPASSTSLPPPSEMLNRVVKGAHETIDRLAETAAPKVQRLQDGMQGANEKLHERADQAKQAGDEWTESLRCTVREHPLAAVATALAIGILFAKLSR